MKKKPFKFKLGQKVVARHTDCHRNPVHIIARLRYPAVAGKFFFEPGENVYVTTPSTSGPEFAGTIVEDYVVAAK